MSLRAQRSNLALDWLAALDFVRCARNDGILEFIKYFLNLDLNMNGGNNVP